MNYILAYNEDLTFNGFYVEGVHENIPTPHISITNELWSHLVSLGQEFKLVEDFILKEEYSLEDVNLFEITESSQETPLEPSLDERMDSLELENAELLLASVEQDLRVTSVEQDLADLMMEIAIMREV